MALAELQAAAARLSVDAVARRLLRNDPVAFAREAGLEPAECAALQEKAEAFERFARSLVNKRAGEAAKAIPLMHAALGESYREVFRQYAEEIGVGRDPAADALAFLRWLIGRKLPNTGLARYEMAGLRFRRGSRWLTVGLFHFRGHASPAPKWIMACWWRFPPGQPARYFQWPSC